MWKTKLHYVNVYFQYFDVCIALYLRDIPYLYYNKNMFAKDYHYIIGLENRKNCFNSGRPTKRSVGRLTLS